MVVLLNGAAERILQGLNNLVKGGRCNVTREGLIGRKMMRYSKTARVGILRGLDVIPLSKKVRRILLGASALVAGVVLFSALWPVPVDEAAPRYVSIAFNGFTNDPGGRAVALFSVSNVTRFTVACPYIGPQVQATNVIKNRTNIVWTWEPGWQSMQLQPGRSATVGVSPTNGAAWRFAVFAERPPGLTQMAAQELESRIPRQLYWRLYGDPRRTQILVSEEVFASHFMTRKKAKSR
jgi:hypothetical protein